MTDQPASAEARRGLAERLAERRSAPARLLPGLGLTAIGVVAALLLATVVPMSPLLIAMLLGIVYGSTAPVSQRLAPGLQLASRRLLRIGVVLLGLRLAFFEILAMGWRVLLLVLVTVTATFVLTLWVGRLMRLTSRQNVLVATGVSICGASAIVAVNSVVDAEEEDIASTVAVVSIYGTVMIFTLPVLGGLLGLDGELFGVWAGASVHEVAQVVATAGAVGSTALAAAVVVKLTRVAMLAPVVALVGLWARRQHTTAGGKRPPLLPLFLLGFLAMVAVRSLEVLPDGVVDAAGQVERLLFTAAMFALGCSVQVVKLVRTAGPRLVLGLISTLVISLLAWAGVMVTA